jgi:hypothetical protein
MEVKDINFAAMPQTAVNVVTKPAEFFKTMPKTGGFLEPLVFAVIMGFIAGIISAILGLLGLTYDAGYTGAWSMLGMIIVMPIAVAIGSFIGAAILFIIWKLIGSQENYETAYRCGAYLMALAPIVVILRVIPYAGGVISMAIYVFFLVIASTQVHNIPSQKAWLVFGIIGVILALMGISGEYKARNLGSQYREKAEEINKQYQRHLEEARKQMEKSRQEAAGN